MESADYGPRTRTESLQLPACNVQATLPGDGAHALAGRSPGDVVAGVSGACWDGGSWESLPAVGSLAVSAPGQRPRVGFA